MPTTNMPMRDRALALPGLRSARHAWLERRFRRCLEDGLAEEFLQLLLGFMAAALVVDPGFRRHVQGFEARYAFRSADGRIALGATLSRGFMWVSEAPPRDPHATVIFRDGRALMRSLLSPEPDLLGALLRQDVTFEGNLNFVYRLAYLARRLQRAVTKAA